MIKHSTQSDLLHQLFELLEQHRRAFRQERSYWRVVGLVLGELFNFGRHTVTQGLMALGLTEGDWSGWYRLFSRRRYAEARVARIFFRETLPHTSPEVPYVVGVGGMPIPRSSLKLAGTSWLKAPRPPVFKVGIHRAQRFVHGAWLTPLARGNHALAYAELQHALPYIHEHIRRELCFLVALAGWFITKPRAHHANIRRGVELLGAAEGLTDRTGAPPSAFYRTLLETRNAIARQRLSVRDWQAAWNRGQAIGLVQSIDYARLMDQSENDSKRINNA